MATVKTTCTLHGHYHEDCNGCRRAAVLAIVERDAELREFQRLMKAPQRVH